ncbi:hypothetical protein B296_00029301 [Ensete ventricosum]|uniref:Uncharacterized protein n=1 Tax=Ensete ventricosum TaxID=4639 RepID=A0A426Y400_ENSVE|nr:hypothetical protein B296_00029301 [Ensete ventricosum]
MRGEAAIYLLGDGAPASAFGVTDHSASDPVRIKPNLFFFLVEEPAILRRNDGPNKVQRNSKFFASAPFEDSRRPRHRSRKSAGRAQKKAQADSNPAKTISKGREFGGGRGSAAASRSPLAEGAAVVEEEEEEKERRSMGGGGRGLGLGWKRGRGTGR